MNRCPACGNALNADAKFCSGCGASIEGGKTIATASTAVAEVTPGSTARHSTESLAEAGVEGPSGASPNKSLKKVLLGLAVGTAVIVGGSMALASGGGDGMPTMKSYVKKMCGVNLGDYDYVREGTTSEGQTFTAWRRTGLDDEDIDAYSSPGDPDFIVVYDYAGAWDGVECD